MTAQLADATKSLFEVLMPLTTEERGRVVSAALVLLGDKLPSAAPVSAPASDGVTLEGPLSGSAWALKNGLSQDILDKFFHFDGDTPEVLDLPAKLSNNREKTAAAYLLLGLARHLAKGDSSFTDADARKLCIKLGCYDTPNHAKTVNAFGNKFTGSKKAGWKLTTPGLNAAVVLVKS